MGLKAKSLKLKVAGVQSHFKTLEMDRQSVVVDVRVPIVMPVTDRIDDGHNEDEDLAAGKLACINFTLTLDHIQV